jgi:hypothetical protein
VPEFETSTDGKYSKRLKKMQVVLQYFPSSFLLALILPTYLVEIQRNIFCLITLFPCCIFEECLRVFLTKDVLEMMIIPNMQILGISHKWQMMMKFPYE